MVYHSFLFSFSDVILAFINTLLDTIVFSKTDHINNPLLVHESPYPKYLFLLAGGKP